MMGPFFFVNDEFVPAAQATLLVTDLSIQRSYYPHRRQMPDTKTIDYLMAIWLQPYIRQHSAGDVLYHLDDIVSECPRSNFSS